LKKSQKKSKKLKKYKKVFSSFPDVGKEREEGDETFTMIMVTQTGGNRDSPL
jgi:hypothetical protein